MTPLSFFLKKSWTLFLAPLLLFSSLLQSEETPSTLQEPLTLQTVYGEFVIDEPVLIELIQSPSMQRLKKIHQYGVSYYITPTEEFSRYDHSIGVFVLLRQYGASTEEQIAGLLHDTSHTVFSHVGDWIFDHPDGKSSYQDNIHLWHLKESGVEEILARYDYPLEAADHKCDHYRALEQDLPDMCADRIEYNLQGGLLRGLLSQEELSTIVKDLHFENDTWFFTDPLVAKQFASLSLFFTPNVWASPQHLLAYQWTAKAIQRAVEIDLVNLDEIHFSIDEVIWERLTTSDDVVIQNYIEKAHQSPYWTAVTDASNYDMHLMGKFRGINPLVQTEQGLQRLTEIDSLFKQEYSDIQALLSIGWYVKDFADEELQSLRTT